VENVPFLFQGEPPNPLSGGRYTKGNHIAKPKVPSKGSKREDPREEKRRELKECINKEKHRQGRNSKRRAYSRKDPNPKKTETPLRGAPPFPVEKLMRQ